MKFYKRISRALRPLRIKIVHVKKSDVSAENSGSESESDSDSSDSDNESTSYSDSDSDKIPSGAKRPGSKFLKET